MVENPYSRPIDTSSDIVVSWMLAAAVFVGLLIISLFSVIEPARAAITSYAIVQDDAALKIRGKIIYLHGIYVPDNGHHCRFTLRPPTCGSRAAIALKQRIRGFVSCYEIVRFRDGSLEAVCYTERTRFRDGVDLGAWLIRQGLAVATPDASFQYHTAERIARSRGRGMWGFSADSIR